MDKKTLQELKEKLEKNKEGLEKNLSSFAKKDDKPTGDWESKYPNFNVGVGSQGTEEAADEVEEYMNLLPVEASLELKLKAVNSALEKIGKENYGKCEKCQKDISLERLKVYPEAKACMKCRS